MFPLATELAVTVSTQIALQDLIDSAMPTITKVDNDWSAAMKEKDAERVTEAYAPDAVFVLPDGREVVGRAAIIELYRARFAAGNEVDETLQRDGGRPTTILSLEM